MRLEIGAEVSHCLYCKHSTRSELVEDGGERYSCCSSCYSAISDQVLAFGRKGVKRGEGSK